MTGGTDESVSRIMLRSVGKRATQKMKRGEHYDADHFAFCGLPQCAVVIEVLSLRTRKNKYFFLNRKLRFSDLAFYLCASFSPPKRTMPLSRHAAED